MPFHDLKCQNPDCGETEEYVMTTQGDLPACPKCGSRRKIDFTNYASSLVDDPYSELSGKGFFAEHMSKEGVWIKSRKHFRDELNKRNLRVKDEGPPQRIDKKQKHFFNMKKT